MDTLVMPYAIKSYTFIIHQAEEGGYWGEILELPGCVSQGETLDELNRNIREALESVLEAEAENPRLEIYEEPILAEKDFLDFRLYKLPGRKHQWVSTNETWTTVQ